MKLRPFWSPKDSSMPELVPNAHFCDEQPHMFGSLWSAGLVAFQITATSAPATIDPAALYSNETFWLSCRRSTNYLGLLLGQLLCAPTLNHRNVLDCRSSFKKTGGKLNVLFTRSLAKIALEPWNVYHTSDWTVRRWSLQLHQYPFCCRNEEHTGLHGDWHLPSQR